MERREFMSASAALLTAAALPGVARAATAGSVDDPASYNHRFADVNGIRMHYVDAGKGPLVILLHGFPLLWYSWRKQIAPLVDAGYRVVVPDQRGYGQTGGPEGVDSYDITHLVGDVVGLMEALGEKSAVVVGWDIGTIVASHSALMRPDLIRAVVLVSAPYSLRTPVPPSAIWKAAFKDKVFYQQYFQEIGKADREMERDPHRTMRSALYSLSADVAHGEGWRVLFNPGETALDNVSDPYARKIARPKQLPPLAERNRPRLLRRAVHRQRLQSCAALVSQFRSQLGADILPRRRQGASARPVRRRQRRHGPAMGQAGDGPARDDDARLEAQGVHPRRGAHVAGGKARRVQRHPARFPAYFLNQVVRTR